MHDYNSSHIVEKFSKSKKPKRKFTQTQRKDLYLELDEPLHGSKALTGDPRDAIVAEIKHLQGSQTLQARVLKAGEQIVTEVQEQQMRHVDERAARDLVDAVLLQLGALQHRQLRERAARDCLRKVILQIYDGFLIFTQLSGGMLQ